MFSARRSSAVAMVFAALTLAACGSGGSSEGSSNPNGNCLTKDLYGNKYDPCDLMDQDQVVVEASVGRQFEIQGFGLPKLGQEIRVVCHTGNIGHSSFGVLVGQGNDLPDGDWTLGKANGKPFAYVGYIVDAAIVNHERVARELKEKLEGKIGNPHANSCEDPRIIASNNVKERLTAPNS